MIAEFQRRGIGKALVSAMLAHPQVHDLPMLLRRTRDAHRLYEQFGFQPLPRPDEMMVRYREG